MKRFFGIVSIIFIVAFMFACPTMPNQGTGAAQQPKGGNFLSLIIMMGLIFAIFYFLMIRPQTKKQKELQRQISELKKGDKILTIGGIYGTVWSIKDRTIMLKVANNVKIEISKNAVSAVIKGDNDSKK